ncbi:hypothetical protein Q8W71_20005 [Methylobacterium sp. NEAU 140]|uniref:hypothetical protein n=1 Tax=Methylobacterium sp. NEAU 140 TaxID=3064945 RepID=UPI0027329B00|nr:hypothetical protein [Methylobacterium sp. NEAU 140]MDP4024919.1 hypothetical protein [Methylobacterium sp. NEAU 140]
MANFQKHGKNVHGTTLQVPAGQPYELGLWGPLDVRNNVELDVSISPANPSVGIVRGSMLSGQPVRVWRFTGLPAGRILVEAKDRSGSTWTSVTLSVGAGADAGASSSGTPGRLYTDNPNEVGTQRTTPTAAQVIDMILSSWPDLNQTGARSLASQFMTETGRGKYCFNWNLGNIKGGAKEPHMYLKNVWECYNSSAVDGAVSAAGGLARAVENESEEARAHGWRCKQAIVVFSPPHAQCRFRAYKNLEDGAQRWVGHHKKIAAGHAGYLDALNAGDIDSVAHFLKIAKYYTAKEDTYAHNMKAEKARIDQQLGAVAQ